VQQGKVRCRQTGLQRFKSLEFQPSLLGAPQSLLLRPARQHDQAASAMAAGQGHGLVESGLVIESELTLQSQCDGETACHRFTTWSARPGSGSGEIAGAGPLEWIVAEQVQ
jgi:hypothetical protein